MATKRQPTEQLQINNRTFFLTLSVCECVCVCEGGGNFGPPTLVKFNNKINVHAHANL